MWIKIITSFVDESDPKAENNLSIKQKAGDSANRWLEKIDHLCLDKHSMGSKPCIHCGFRSIAVMGGIFL